MRTMLPMRTMIRAAKSQWVLSYYVSDTILNTTSFYLVKSMILPFYKAGN